MHPEPRPEVIEAKYKQILCREPVELDSSEGWNLFIEGSRFRVRSSERHPIQWDMSGRRADEEGISGQKAVVRAVEGFHAAIVESARAMQSLAPGTSDVEHEALLQQLPLTHDGDRRFREHVLNARRRVVRGIGISFGKEHAGSARKIDATAAAMLARQCRQDYLSLPEDRQRRRSFGWVVR